MVMTDKERKQLRDLFDRAIALAGERHRDWPGIDAPTWKKKDFWKRFDCASEQLRRDVFALTGITYISL